MHFFFVLVKRLGSNRLSPLLLLLLLLVLRKQRSFDVNFDIGLGNHVAGRFHVNWYKRHLSSAWLTDKLLFVIFVHESPRLIQHFGAWESGAITNHHESALLLSLNLILFVTLDVVEYLFFCLGLRNAFE
jgi:hypothetical protein